MSEGDCLFSLNLTDIYTTWDETRAVLGKTQRAICAALEEIRDQLFAEAAQMYRDGRPWWPDRAFEKAVISPMQDERQWHDAWAERADPLLEVREQITGIGSMVVGRLRNTWSAGR